MINKDMIPKKGMSQKIVENIAVKPNSGITNNIVGQGKFTEKKSNYDMDRLKYECIGCKDK